MKTGGHYAPLGSLGGHWDPDPEEHETDVAHDEGFISYKESVLLLILIVCHHIDFSLL